MKVLSKLLLAGLLLGGCATAPPTVQTPILLVGIVEDARWTDWAFDFCGHGQPVRFNARLGSAECIPHGGELYAATLVFPKQPGGTSMSRSLKIAFPGHAIPEYYSETHYVVLQPSPPDFEAATGIKFVAAVRDNYDRKQKCLKEIGFGHVDWRHCPDESFHERNRGRCLPVSEWLAHYGPAPNNSFKPKPLRGSA